jgi:cysteine desulfurase
VIGIAGFGAAAQVAIADREVDSARVQKLRDRLEEILRQTCGIVIFSHDAPRLPNTTLFALPGLKAETAVIGFDLAGIAVSSGAACSSGKVQPSHVLHAMGAAPELLRGAIRISLGWETTEASIDRCGKVWQKLSGTLITGKHETELERFQTS